MTALEKAARARCERMIRADRDWSLFPGQLEEILPEAVEYGWRDELPEIIAVISSIEVDDAMVEVAARAMALRHWPDDERWNNYVPAACAALTASLRSILEDGAGT